MRFEVKDESYKEGRKVIKQYGLWDKAQQKIIARFADIEAAESAAEIGNADHGTY